MHTQLSGILVLDKPEGISSARALAEVKKHLGADKAGHAGTLDPLATGLLICCIGAATRLARFFVQSQKTYEAVLRLGITTDSQDMTGAVMGEADVPDVTLDEVGAIVAQFQGPQLQEPPIYAALKHQGTPLYKLARRGEPVQKPARPVEIHAIRIVAMQLPDVQFRVTCSAGTYVRTLCAQIGQRIGCGGHMAGLRRIHCGGFAVHEAIGLDELAILPRAQGRERIIPMAEALRELPALRADAGLLAHIAQGRALNAERMAGTGKSTSEYLKVVDDRGVLRAVLQKRPDNAGYLYSCVFN
jgi:tRNA pseudouridine55 synthase